MSSCPDRATPMLDKAINKPYYGEANTRIFNFNTHQCYDSTIDGHLGYFDVLDCDTTIYVDNKAKTLAWGTNIPRKETGVQLRLSTIPGVVYHMFFTGQLTLGNQVFLRIKNRNPIIYLSSEITWKIGDQESKTACFRALSHQTDLIIFTDTDCVQDLAPFAFTVFHLTIIPECYMCKGYIEGPPGLAGPQGAPGVSGTPGITFTGPSGPIGPSGIEGPTGSTGPQGALGLTGPQGPVGPVGVQGIQPGPDGSQGPTGPYGFFGAVGALGPTGAQGSVGPIGTPAPGVGLGPGPDGETGDPGPMGDLGHIGPTGPTNSGTITSGSFMIAFRRDVPGPPQPALGVTTVFYEKIGSEVTLKVCEFTVGAGGASSPISSDSFSSVADPFVAAGGIGPSAGPRIYPVNIILNGTPTLIMFTITGGVGSFIFYRTLSQVASFLNTDVVEFPSVSLTYLQ